MLVLIMKTILKINQVYNVSDVFLCGDFRGRTVILCTSIGKKNRRLFNFVTEHGI